MPDLAPDLVRSKVLQGAFAMSDAASSDALSRRLPGESLVRLVRRLGLGDEQLASATLARLMQRPLADPASLKLLTRLPDGLNPGFLEGVDAALVAGDTDSALILAVADPDVDQLARGIGVATRRTISVQIAELELIERARRIAGPASASESLADPSDGEHGSGGEDDAPAVRVVDELISAGARARASDLHLECYPDRVRIRFRIDGVLHDWRALSPRQAKVLVSRIKIMAGLDIAERRLPQDGRAHATVDGDRFDLRIATLPSAHGEGVVVRFLRDTFSDLTLEHVGMEAEDLAKMRRALSAPFGLVLVVGPTGAGKSTTLAAALAERNRPGQKLISIEDPVEHQIDGVTQIAVKPSIGLTFARALRAILRNDPDVIVVGELRDPETAEIATNAALTGHLVIATVHANTAAAAIPRMMDLGVSTSLIRSTLRLVAAQRLVRQLCQNCREADGESYAAIGCRACGGTGYSGRTGIFEMLDVDETVAELIRPACNAGDFSRFTRSGDLSGLHASALAKVRSGQTTRDEVLRVLGG